MPTLPPQFDPQKNAGWKPAPNEAWDVTNTGEDRVEFDPQKNADWKAAPEGSWDVNDEETPDLNLDPVEIQSAAATVARAKKAIEYLKKSLDALKTGKNEKKEEQAMLKGQPTSAEQMGQEFAEQNPPGTGGDMSGYLDKNIEGYEAPKGIPNKTDALFAAPAETDNQGIGLSGLTQRLKDNKAYERSVMDSL